MRHRENKSFTRLYIPHDFAPEITCDLPENQIHYIRNVLRMSAGDQLIVFNGKDGEWIAELTEIAKKRGSISLIEQTRPQSASSDLWAVFAPIKKARQDFLVEKATELGVSRLLPVITDYCNNARMNKDRVTAQTIEAAEQCERLDMPEIDDLQKLNTLLNTWPEDRTLLVCAEKGDAVPIATAAQNLKGNPVGILVGPEGGFSDQELELLASKDFTQMIDLGPRILRAETALITALSSYQMISLAS